MVNLIVFPPRQIGHVGHHRNTVVVGGEFGNDADVFSATSEADFDHLRGNVFQNCAGLIANGFFVERKKVKNGAYTNGFTVG